MCSTPVPYTVGLVLSYLVQTGEAHNSPFSACPFLGCDRWRSANGKGNRSSPLYAICLNWITFLQCVGFDSNYSFTDVTVKSNRTGNIPRQGSGLSCRLSQPEAGSLTRFTASIIKHLMLHRKGDRTRQFLKFLSLVWSAHTRLREAV